MVNQITILYIEDDDASRRLIERFLVTAGYNVLSASRALEGIDLAKTHRPDLILTDINLPDLSGRDIAVRLRTDPTLESVPIVALTAQSHSLEREKTFVAGVTGYITKPVNLGTLIDKIERYLHGEKDRVDVSALKSAQQAYREELVARLEDNVRELEASNQELRRLDRIKDDFIQLTAHELRTPLTTVYGYSRLVQSLDVIQQVMAQNPEARACLVGLVDSIERLSVVINEIVIVSRIASGRVDLKPGTANLKKVIERVIEGYQQASEQRQLTVKVDPETWPTEIFGDELLLDLAFSNVFGNAIKYTPDGGTITLQAEIQETRVQISVHDTGIGINPDDQRRIFDRFYTAGDTQLHSTSKTAFRGGGLGLGLAICRGIINAHHGKMWVESDGCDEDRLPGSTFYINLPLERPRIISPIQHDS
ncbi:MAG: hybrid sensor histidine kinase/response regulator [Anaerolineae bacterium]|nr:hybrid sensor histidine kinase/response regulator [Anaerolineae bacterium]